jgi:glutamate 5-kinase
MLSDVDALYDMPPSKPGAKRISDVAFGTSLDQIEIGGTSTGYGTGGAVTKVGAAKIAADHGIAVLLTSTPNVAQALNGQDVGTWFEPRAE